MSGIRWCGAEDIDRRRLVRHNRRPSQAARTQGWASQAAGRRRGARRFKRPPLPMAFSCYAR